MDNKDFEKNRLVFYMKKIMYVLLLFFVGKGIFSSSFPIRLMYAKDYMRHKKYNLSLMYVDEYLALFPNGKYIFAAYEIMAQCYIKMFKYKQAAEIFILLYSLSNKDTPIYLFKAGKLYSLSGFYRKAVDIFDTIIDRYKGLEIAKKSIIEKQIVEVIRQNR